MRKRRLSMFIQKCSGIVIAVTGITLIVNTLPFYLWPLLLGCFLVWMGWHLYAVKS
ncbi:MAG TPA: hypothetical protein GX004_00895 [Firmicutes bacterium]|nr:hypothetical protein [Bacillota bacterium]